MKIEKNILTKNILSTKEFAQLGDGKIAYLREIGSDELKEKFPNIPPIASGISLWGLFGATGEPIILSDARAKALEGANEHELKTVTLH